MSYVDDILGPGGVLARATRERFDAKYDKRGPNECWPWTGAKLGREGYGSFRVGGKTRRAHVIALEEKLGRAILPGKQANHTCDNPACCNPAHVYEGTHAENMRDRNERGRTARTTGDRNGARLHPEKLARGDCNGARLYPERMVRHFGDKNGSRLHPERRPRGVKHQNAKLTEEAVCDIRRGTETLAIYAARYGVSQTTVSRVRRGKRWVHVVS